MGPGRAGLSPSQGRLLSIEVIYSPSAAQFDSVRLSLPMGACVRDALRMSGLLERHHGIDLERMKVGVWGKWAGLDQGLRDLDRVEIYRPLSVDPKEARRRRATGNRTK
ncbi:MAG: RnfH family protein [Burkholderiaceae bacterium]